MTPKLSEDSAASARVDAFIAAAERQGRADRAKTRRLRDLKEELVFWLIVAPVIGSILFVPFSLFIALLGALERSGR